MGRFEEHGWENQEYSSECFKFKMYNMHKWRDGKWTHSLTFNKRTLEIEIWEHQYYK